MLDTSSDILRLTLALAIAFLTGFLCWSIYSITRIIRQVAKIIDHIETLVTTVQEQVSRLHELFSLIEEKIQHMGSAIPLILNGIQSIMSFVSKRKAARASQAKSKAKSASSF